MATESNLTAPPRLVGWFEAILRRAALPTVIAVVCACGFVWLAFGSLQNTSAYFRGEFVLAAPNIREVGPVGPGKEYTAKFTLRNITSESVVLLGAETCCGCELRSKVPLTIQPKGTATIEFAGKIGASQPAGAFTRRFPLLIDKGGGRGPMITIRVAVVASGGVAATPPRATAVFIPCVVDVRRQSTEFPVPRPD